MVALEGPGEALQGLVTVLDSIQLSADTVTSTLLQKLLLLPHNYQPNRYPRDVPFSPDVRVCVCVCDVQYVCVMCSTCVVCSTV